MTAIPLIIKILLIVLCVEGIVGVVCINGCSRFSYEKKTVIIQDILFSLPMVSFIIALIII